MKKYLNGDLFKQNHLPEVKRFFLVILFTGIYGLGMAWFLMNTLIEDPISLYSGGIPGIAQIVIDFFRYTLNTPISNPNLFISLIIVIVNIPILVLGWFKVSKKFTFYSLVSIIVQSTVIGFIPSLPTGLDGASGYMANAVLGGLLTGVGVGGTLRIGASTGGFDIISQYFSFKKGKSVGFFSMILNVAIALLGGVLIMSGNKAAFGTGVNPVEIGFMTIAYTVIRIIVTTIATDKIHTSYQYLGVEIVTDHPKELIDEIFLKLGRGVTLLEVHGAYSQATKTMLYIVISAYEFPAMKSIVQRIDETAFMVTSPVRNVVGNFKRKTIA